MKRIFLLAIFLFSVVLINQYTFAQDEGNKIYWMSTIEIPLANLSEYHSFNAKELAPLMAEHGYNEFATWQTIVGAIEEVIYVAEFENMSAYHKARKSLLGSDDWKKVGKKFGNLSKGIKTKFLSAAPYSKLK
jgi:NIPSNAP